jgi:hypothetical protein
MVTELAKQSFTLRTIDGELAELTADAQAGGRRRLTFEADRLLVELEIDGPRRSRRVLGELVPTGSTLIEVRQPGEPEEYLITDEDGRFVIEQLRPGPFSLTCHRSGQRPVCTEWTRLD